LQWDLITLEEIYGYQVEPDRYLNSATPEEVLRGLTTDIYFIRTREILNSLGLLEAEVSAEIFSTANGVLAGVEEAVNFLRKVNGSSQLKVWTVPEGEYIQEKEVVFRIEGPYGVFGAYETTLLGMLASSSGWATAARECKEAAGEKNVFCFGARHVHPSVAPVMERAALVGGADGCSCILGARLKDRLPVGTVPHAVFLVAGDTVKVAEKYDEIMHQDSPRIILVDTFKDEAEEALRVAEALKENLDGVRLDTPGERGGVTAGLVREVKARLQQAGHSQVQVFVSGGMTAERIALLSQAGADAFGVGSYISRAPAIDMTMDIKEVNGKPVAKRGRIPGRILNERLVETGL